MKTIPTGVMGGALVGALALSLTTPTAAQAATSSSFDLGASLAIPELGAVRVDTSHVELANADVSPSDLSATYDAPYTAYTTTLQNDLPWTQSLTSQSNTVTTTDTTTATVENGVTNIAGAGASVGFTAGFFNASANVRWELQSSVKFTDTTTSTVSSAWTVPSQTIFVPANTKVLVQAEIQKARFSGKLKLTGNLTGNVTFTNGCGETYSLPVGKVLALRKNDGAVVTPPSVVPDGDLAKFTGTASFTGVSGTSMTVKVSVPGGVTQRTTTKAAVAPPATGAPRSAAPPTARTSQIDMTGVTTFAALAEKIACGSTASTAGYSYVLGEDGRVSFVGNGATVVSPASTKFASVTGDSANGSSYALAIATDGSVWSTRDSSPMTKVPLSGRAKATAGHGYVLGEDGRIAYVGDGRNTVVSPTSLTFTSVTGDWAQGNNYALAIASDGSAWMTQDGNPMRQIPLAGRAKATAAHGYVLSEDGRITYVATSWWNGGIAPVSPASVRFTSITGDWGQGHNYVLAIASDGSAWMTEDGQPMRQIPLAGRAKATAGHGFVLGEDGRITYVATSWWNGGTTVVSPPALRFTALTGNWEGRNRVLAIASDGTAWSGADGDAMRQVAAPSARR